MNAGMLPQTVNVTEPTKPSSKNLLGKTRSVDSPYMTFRMNDWEWRVLKAYKSKPSEDKDQYARWFLATKSPNTYGEFELGDGYIKDITRHAVCVQLSPEAEMAGYKLG